MMYVNVAIKMASAVIAFLLINEPSAIAKGFKITILGLPTIAKFPFPDAVNGDAQYLVGSVNMATDVFAGISGLENVSPYIGLQPGANVSFIYSSPQKVFTFLWGTPDPYNTVTFYDGAGNFIEQLDGTEIQSKVGFPSQVTVRIASSVPFQSVVLSTTSCCFEFANVHP